MKSYRYIAGALLAAGLFSFSAVPGTFGLESAAAEEAFDELFDEAEEWMDPSGASGTQTDASASSGDKAEDQKDAKDLIEDSGSSSSKGLPDGLSIAGKVRAADPANRVQPMVTVDPSKYPAASFTENAQEVYWYCRLQLGLNHAAACGVLGNVHLESSFRPLALGDGGTSYGICQWHLGRLTNLMNYCRQNGLDYNTLTGQLAYLSYELNGSYKGFYEALRTVSDTPAGAQYAGWLMCVYFEMPDQADARGHQRGNLAMNNYYPKNFFESAAFTVTQTAFVKTQATAMSQDAAQLPEGTKVTLLSLSDGWAEISYTGTDHAGQEETGYIPARILTRVADSDDVFAAIFAESEEEKIETDTSREVETEAETEEISEEETENISEEEEEETEDISEEVTEDGSEEPGI